MEKRTSVCHILNHNFGVYSLKLEVKRIKKEQSLDSSFLLFLWSPLKISIRCIFHFLCCWTLQGNRSEGGVRLRRQVIELNT